jgi:hypothetical protein
VEKPCPNWSQKAGRRRREPERMRYKAELEEILRNGLRKQDPFANVTISDKGEFVVIESEGKIKRRRLSALGKQYLRTSSAFLVTPGDSFLEPEDEEGLTG